MRPGSHLRRVWRQQPSPAALALPQPPAFRVIKSSIQPSQLTAIVILPHHAMVQSCFITMLRITATFCGREFPTHNGRGTNRAKTDELKLGRFQQVNNFQDVGKQKDEDWRKFPVYPRYRAECSLTICWWHLTLLLPFRPSFLFLYALHPIPSIAQSTWTQPLEGNIELYEVPLLSWAPRSQEFQVSFQLAGWTPSEMFSHLAVGGFRWNSGLEESSSIALLVHGPKFNSQHLRSKAVRLGQTLAENLENATSQSRPYWPGQSWPGLTI